MSVTWTSAGEYSDIRYELSGDGIAKITINRPEVRNAFRPQTLFELADAFDRARDDPEVGVIILTGEGTDAFCSGGDQRIRGDDGYIGDDAVAAGIGRLNVLDLQMPDPPHCPSRSSRWSPATRSAAGTSCTSCATSRSPPTTPASARPGPKVGSLRRRLRLRAAGAHRRPEEGPRDLVPVPPVRRPGRRSTWGWSTRSCRSTGSRRRPSQWCREMLALSPARAAHAQGVVQRRRRRPGRHPAARRRRDAALLHDRRGARRAATPTSRSGKPDFAQFPRRP